MRKSSQDVACLNDQQWQPRRAMLIRILRSSARSNRSKTFVLSTAILLDKQLLQFYNNYLLLNIYYVLGSVLSILHELFNIYANLYFTNKKNLKP